MRADNGSVFSNPVVVSEDGSRTNIGAFADFGIPYVGEVGYLGVLADL